MIRILIVDDQAHIRQGLHMRLSLEADLSIVGEAENGLQALQVVAELLPDVIIMDIEMPELDGLAATRSLSAQFPHLRVIIMSIHDSPDLRVRAQAAGASAYLEKSTSVDALLAEIRNPARRTAA